MECYTLSLSMCYTLCVMCDYNWSQLCVFQLDEVNFEFFLIWMLRFWYKWEYGKYLKSAIRNILDLSFEIFENTNISDLPHEIFKKLQIFQICHMKYLKNYKYFRSAT